MQARSFVSLFPLLGSVEVRRGPAEMACDERKNFAISLSLLQSACVPLVYGFFFFLFDLSNLSIEAIFGCTYSHSSAASPVS